MKFFNTKSQAVTGGAYSAQISVKDNVINFGQLSAQYNYNNSGKKAYVSIRINQTGTSRKSVDGLYALLFILEKGG